MRAYLIRLAKRMGYGITFSFLVSLFLLIVLWGKIVYTVPAGHGGVVWHSLQHRFDENYNAYRVGEGLKMIWPWDKFYLYDLRLLTHTESYQVTSNSGLEFEIDLTFRYKVNRPEIVALNAQVGLDYLNSMVVPEIGSQLRVIVAGYDAEGLYMNRNVIQDDIYMQVTSESLPNHIGPRLEEMTNPEQDGKGIQVLLQDTLLTTIRLPEKVKKAIESKIAESEFVEEYEFRVERERLESKRKQIEAEGIRDFQRTVSPAITDSYLRWRGIEATLSLAKSPNSKVIVIGNSDSGLPIILDTKDD